MDPVTIEPLPDYRLFRRVVVMAVAALILFVVSFSAWKSYSEYRLTIQGAEQQTRGYASALREHAERTFGEADNTLQDIIEYIGERGGIHAQTGETLHAVMNGRFRNSPQIASTFLVNRDGLVFAHSADVPVKQAAVADRDYFIHHRDNPADNTPFVSKPLKSRITGKWHLVLSRPQRNGRGEFDGVVAVALDLDYFRKFYTTLELGAGGKIAMVRRDGELLLAVPFKESDYATDFKKSHLIRTYLPRAPKGTYHIAPGKALLESNARIVSYDALEKFPIVALANMDEDEVLAQWKQNTVVQALLVGAVSAALGLLALVLLRQVKRIEASHRVQLEQQARIASSAEAWQSTFDAVEDAIWVMGVDRRVLRANRATEQVFGKSRDRVVGHMCCEVAHDGTTPVADCPFQKMLDTGHRASMQIALGNHWYDVSVDPVKNDSGEITGAVHIVSDITDIKQMEMLLHQARKMEAVGHLAGGIAHDFNNLLTPILGYAEMVAAALQPDHPLFSKVAGISTAAHRAKELTRQLLSFGRRQAIAAAVLNLNEVIESFYSVLRRTIRESIAFDLRLDPAGTFVTADRSQMEQIILNLTVNAQDALGGSGTIAIETCRVFMDGENARLHPGMTEGEYVLLTFSDSGCGMSSEVLSHIFEPFFTTKQAGHGTGLGLATVYGIVKQHNGHISVDSRENEGTTFRIFLPATDVDALLEKREAAVAPARNHGGKTILVVEDNEMVMDMVREMLAGYGYRVLTAADGNRAIEVASGNCDAIDLLVSDIVMPGMNGPELYERLLVQIPSLRVVFISGYPLAPGMRQGSLEEEVSYLQKPFTAEALLERIRMVMGE